MAGTGCLVASFAINQLEMSSTSPIRLVLLPHIRILIDIDTHDCCRLRMRDPDYCNTSGDLTSRSNIQQADWATLVEVPARAACYRLRTICRPMSPSAVYTATLHKGYPHSSIVACFLERATYLLFRRGCDCLLIA